MRQSVILGLFFVCQPRTHADKSKLTVKQVVKMLRQWSVSQSGINMQTKILKV